VGTASLVFGLIAIGAGLWVVWSDLLSYGANQTTTEEFWLILGVMSLPLFVIGGFLLRKYGKDRKK